MNGLRSLRMEKKVVSDERLSVGNVYSDDLKRGTSSARTGRVVTYLEIVDWRT